jgi:hypothetical protein
MSTFSEYNPISGRLLRALQKMQMKRRQRARELPACLQKNRIYKVYKVYKERPSVKKCDC